MPKPKSYKSYNAIYPTVIRKCQEFFLAGEPVQPIPFANAPMAVNFRATFYAFRYAMRRELVANPSNAEIAELAAIGDNLSIKLSGSVVTIVDNRRLEVHSDALADFLNTEVGGDQEQDEQFVDDSDNLEDLFKD